MIVASRMRSNSRLLKFVLQSNQIQINPRRCMLTTTQLKLNNSYDVIRSYIEKRFSAIQKIHSSADSQFNQSDYESLNKFQRLFETSKRIETTQNEITELTNLINTTVGDDELKKLASSDLEKLDNETRNLKNQLIDSLVEDEREDNENAVLEVSAGVGGQEAMLFCKEIFEMYRGYSLFKDWTFEQTHFDCTDIGGVRHANAIIRGEKVFKYLKFESGVHRVQRVPKTERTGRIHTSTVTVAILPKPDQITIELEPKDLKIEACRSSGPGGQHVSSKLFNWRLMTT
jgi:protein subunit release factor A